MFLPAILFALLVALLFGALYHLLRDGGFWRLTLYLLLSVVGFAIGHSLGAWQGWNLVPVGPLDFGSGSLGSFVILILGDWLSRIQSKPQSTV
jgi:hypothetical protein